MFQYISKDFAGIIKGVLTTAFGKQFTIFENNPGELRLTLPLKSPLADSSIVGKHTNIIEVFEGTTLRFAGIVEDLIFTEDTVTVIARSYLQVLGYLFARKAGTGVVGDYYNSNVTRDNNAFSAIAINTIITTIFNNAKAETDSLLGATKINVALGTVEAPVSPATASVKADFITALDFIEALTEMAREANSMAVFEITPGKVFNFFANKNIDQSNAVFILGKNLIRIDYAEYASSISNVGFGVGSGLAGAELKTTSFTDAVSRSAFGAMHDAQTYKDINTVATLDSLLKNYVKQFKDPEKLMGFRLKTNLFDGWNIGDNVRIIAKNGLLNIDEFRRVVGVGVFDGDKTELSILTEAKRT